MRVAAHDGSRATGGDGPAPTSAQEPIQEIRDHLPKGYYRRLPKIAAGHLAGTPRVHGLARMRPAHTDSHSEIETLERFVRAHQRIQLLEIGELWAAPMHLRIPRVENPRRLSNPIADSREARAMGNAIADRSSESL